MGEVKVGDVVRVLNLERDEVQATVASILIDKGQSERHNQTNWVDSGAKSDRDPKVLNVTKKYGVFYTTKRHKSVEEKCFRGNN